MSKIEEMHNAAQHTGEGNYRLLNGSPDNPPNIGQEYEYTIMRDPNGIVVKWGRLNNERRVITPEHMKNK